MTPVALVDYMEQCYSIAFSLRIILANFPSWTLVDPNRQPFSEHTDYISLVHNCLAHIKKTTGETESNSKSAPTASPKKSTPRPKVNAFELDTTPRKGASPKRKLDYKEEEGVSDRVFKKAKH